MGFYGNITNTARTQFQFDRVYPNRYSMELSMSTDGVYAGRYVLIEYDQNPGGSEYYQELYLTGNKYYLGYDAAKTARAKYPQDITINEIVRVYSEKPPVAQGEVDKRQPDFYKCTGGNNEGFAVFEKITDSGIAPYTQNYAIDLAEYDNVGRGWDSTVWQKVYTQGVEKYVMIAELNTVVPTFDIVPDAPTLAPIAPHFDANSNNVYYQLHYQPQWGMRVRSAGLIDSSGEGIDENGFHSDEDIAWRRETYDKANDIEGEQYYFADEGIWRSLEPGEEIPKHPAAIYYNKAGFNSEIITHNTDTNNVISVEATGLSGQKYNTHNGISKDPTKPDKNEYAVAEDIQEITIMLPSIGNAIASLWDLIYGNSEQNGGNKRNHDIAWETKMQPERKGLRLVENNGNGFTYSDSRINTLAGCINSIHDLMGMIIINTKPTPSATTYANNKIYYYDNKYWRVHKTYKYTNITQQNFSTSGEYYYNVKNGNFPQYGLWNNEVGYVDGLATRVEAYEMQELEGFARDFNTIHGLLLEIRKILETGDMLTRDQSTVQGSINILNDIIAKFARMTPTNVMIVDELGRVHGAPQTTEQTFTYKNEGWNDGSQDGNYAASEDRWIYWDVDDNYENPLITLQHNFTKVDDTITTADKNTDGANGTGNNKTHGDTIELYTPIVDGMGHVVGKNIETVTLPYGFKTITTNGSNSSSVNDMKTATDDIVADNTQDTLAINSYNKWIKIANNASEDSITFAHEVNPIYMTSHGTTNSNTEPGAINENNINIPDWSYDAAGHITGKHDHYYTLPYGFKTIKSSNTEDNAVNAPATTIKTTGQIADKTQDTLNINASNRWIKIDNNTEDTIKLGHRLSNFEPGKANTLYGLAKDTSIADLDADNTFEVPYFRFDEAGHIDFAETHTVTIPENFDKVAITLSDTNNADKLVGIEGTIEADTLTDTLTLAEGNRWINIDADTTKDKVTFSHYVKHFDEISENIDFDNKNTFSVQEIVWDRAGHIVGSQKKNYILQDGFKQITVKNSGADIKTTATGQGASLIADNQVDNATIDTGNRWISLVGDANNDKFTIYHTFAGEVKKNGSANLAINNNVKPQFGGKFKVFTAGIDEAGHVNNLSDYEITLPKPSLNDLTATGSSVLTGISMKDESGAITQTNANVGTLALTDYNQGTDSGDLAASDSINSAFAKLQNQIHAEEKVRQEAITNEAAARANSDTTLTNNLNKEIENRQTAVQGEATARAKAITAEQQARAQAITQEVTDRNSAISTAIGNVTGGSTETIASLLAKLETLQSQYNDLLARVIALEANHSVEEEPIV